MIQSLLIANRGEIACRIIRTARAMGIRTVAVYSDADAKALHVRTADEAVHIGPSPARESYLVGEKIIAAAKATGAEAIHPGYGFLSENAEFAQAVIDGGLIWVGPNPSSITAMGLKDAAKKLMDAAGVPTTPGYLGENQDPAFLAERADEIGYPVLIKAVAGGGGKGMRKVDAAEDFADSLASCQREAASSFGNDVVLIEKYIQRPRHIEVQVFGDSHGNIVHLFERDCSLQRRHQKVIEEAPAPGVTQFTREMICNAAVRAAKAVDYVGAGTIEFIADSSKGYIDPEMVWFMEMNTRLQVEHPVTEEITGIDLVEWQLRVASGEALPLTQEQLKIEGHAVEVRLYAEDPATGFLPSTGTLEVFNTKYGPARVETGVEAGDAISPHYDPMIAKLISIGDDREDALEQMADELDELCVGPVKTNAWFLRRLLDVEAFRKGEMDTGLIAGLPESIVEAPVPSQDAKDAAVSLLRGYDLSEECLISSGFRLNAPPLMRARGLMNGEVVEGNLIAVGHQLSYLTEGGKEWLMENAQTYEVLPYSVRGSHGGALGDGAILSPMPGRIIAVMVAAGDTVTKGQKLLTLEAMKMEHTLTAPFDGVVAELNAEAGGQVQVEALLARIEAE